MAQFFKNAIRTDASRGSFSNVAGDQHNWNETHHIAGDTNDYHDTVNNGDQYFGEVQAEVVGGKGHNNSFYGRNQTGLASPSVQDTQGDELLEAQIALTRARHDNKRLVAELAAAKAQLDSARAELAVYKQ